MSNFSQSNYLATQHLTPALAAFGTDLREQHIKALITQSRSKVNYSDQNSWGTPAVFSSGNSVRSGLSLLVKQNTWHIKANLCPSRDDRIRLCGLVKSVTILDINTWHAKANLCPYGAWQNIYIIIIDWSNLSHCWKGRKYRKQRGRPSDSSALVLFVCCCFLPDPEVLVSACLLLQITRL